MSDVLEESVPEPLRRRLWVLQVNLLLVENRPSEISFGLGTIMYVMVCCLYEGAESTLHVPWRVSELASINTIGSVRIEG